MNLTPQQAKQLQETYSYLTNFDDEDPTKPIDPVTYQDPSGDRLIHIAAQRGDFETVELLLAAGEDVNAIGDMGLTPAHCAASGLHRDVFELLFRSGADGAIVDEFGRTPQQRLDFFERDTDDPLDQQKYRVAWVLYSRDGKRSAEVREFSNGQTYLLESDWVEGTTFRARHSGRMVGPFSSPKDAEHFIVATSWFNGAK